MHRFLVTIDIFLAKELFISWPLTKLMNGQERIIHDATIIDLSKCLAGNQKQHLSFATQEELNDPVEVIYVICGGDTAAWEGCAAIF